MHKSQFEPPRPMGVRKPSLAATLLDRAFIVVFAAGFFLLTTRLGAPSAGDGLDPSWTVVLAWAFENKLRWGQDIVFTYGPLGFLHPIASYFPAAYGEFVAGQVIVGLLGAFVAAQFFGLLNWAERLLLVVVAYLQIVVLCADPLWIIIFSYSLFTTQRLCETAASPVRLGSLIVATAVYAAITTAIKVSLFPLALLWWAGATLMLAVRRRVGLAGLSLAGFPLATLAVWLVAGQTLSDLPRHLQLSFNISAEYGHAMSAFAPLLTEVYGLALLGTIGVLLLMQLWRSRTSLSAAITVLFFGAATFLAWRAGYTRADGHTMAFSCVVSGLAVAIAAFPKQRSAALYAVCAVLALAGVPMLVTAWNPTGILTPRQLVDIAPAHVRSVARQLRNLAPTVQNFEQSLEADRKRLDLPQTRQVVGTSTIDLVGWQQGVLLLNRLNYRPRPIFQSYAAYSPVLARVNEAHFTGPMAPQFVLLPFSQIDTHYPTSEDPLTFLALLRGYQPAHVEGGYLLLKRTAGDIPAFAAIDAVSFRSSTLGTWVDVPAAESGTVLSLRARPSALGRAFAFLVREPSWRLEVQLDNSETHTFRIVRTAAEAGFLLDPFVNSLDDYARLFIGDPLPRVRRFRLIPQSDVLSALYQHDFSYATAAMALPTSNTIVSAAVIASLFPGFDRRPAISNGQTAVIVEDGRPALFVHSPGRLAFELDAGRYHLDAEIGIRNEALSAAGCTGSDGVVFEVAASTGSPGSSVRQPHNPFADPALKGPHPLRADIVLPQAGTLSLTVQPGASPTCDWAYVRNLRISAPQAPSAPPATH
ncbi:hypothetical protein [Tahibacter amnicola]|uniref:4-amino-4-deoxy-L-arabinose transferase-like glycosyltransferase n=1 Tax=Tahibacter amnicola TaxID=2976241 RepID=A0ABY6BGR3_9GAMM|nr:hypothetical protein [Tahibacter amnicola]UXI69216.1 hypothetical protein N4264_06095 [Tahibacter amnicola]